VRLEACLVGVDERPLRAGGTPCFTRELDVILSALIHGRPVSRREGLPVSPSGLDSQTSWQPHDGGIGRRLALPESEDHAVAPPEANRPRRTVIVDRIATPGVVLRHEPPRF
jgi:hypothetical protein